MEGMLTNMERSELEMGIHDGLQEGSDNSVGDYSGDKEQSSQDASLGDLPEHCIAAILSCLSPREVSRVACVCRSFRAASNFDSVWEHILPPKYKDLLALDPEIDPTQFASKKEVFDHLCNFPLVFEKKTQGFWLDRETGGVCLSISAKGITIIWSTTPEYWDWFHDPNSLFPEVARLKHVCWFEAKGEIKWSLPPGKYTFSWRLFLDHQLSGWRQAPATFNLSKNEEEFFQRKCYIDQSHEYSRRQVGDFTLPTFRDVENGWREYDVGEFEVEEGEDSCFLKFSMLAFEVGCWKSGLIMDGVVVRPTNTIRESPQAETNQRSESGFHTPEFQPEGPDFQFPEDFDHTMIRYVLPGRYDPNHFF
ncbi:hypothetical protein KC19_5G105400 [Ceratodon purpureus]|uniref:F-box domain-containing protein n=1 Tax=Ceratodon purpureus TaxID=3225 RepID=A0A8T0I007_CERPU|nr:hypothetical protein KC19_5G105400 [Ceratodon purpureus]